MHTRQPGLRSECRMFPRCVDFASGRRCCRIPRRRRGSPEGTTFPSRPSAHYRSHGRRRPGRHPHAPIGQWLSEHLSQPVIVENRPGAGTNTATEVVVRASPDGYTLFSAGPASAINAPIYDKLSFNFLRDTAPVAGVMRVSNVLVVHPSFPARTVPEFIAYTKAYRGNLSMASGGWQRIAHGRRTVQDDGWCGASHAPYRGQLSTGKT